MKGKLGNFLGEVKKYWNTPASGRYIPFKEIVCYGVGGMGVHFATTLASAIGLSAGNFIVGASLNIDPFHLQIMSIVANIFGFLVTMVRSYLFDNTKSKDGKFRPWLKWMGVPTVAASILFVWMPYESMTYVEKVVTVEICFLLINCFNPFFTEAFNLLIQVMSPSTEERTDVMSIGQIIFSFAPTITNLIIPALAPLTGGLNNIQTYRIIYPIFTLFGLALTYFIYSGTRERIIYSKKQDRSIRFMDAVRSVAKNKYFWITNIATWIGFLESAYLTILQWSFVYAMPEKQGWLGVANTVIGNGALWAMMIAPFLIRRFGKRNLLIWCNLSNIVLLAVMYISYTNIWAVMIICYINNFINVFGNIYNPGIQADMKDYQQWKTGERIDGMFNVVGIIGTVIGMGTGFVLPALYRMCGLNTDYDVLYDATIRNNIFQMLIIASVVGAVLNVIPYLFYDLTEEKHRGIVKVLRMRAMFDDYANDVLDDAELIETMQDLERSGELEGKQKQPIPRDGVRDAKRLPKITEEERAERSERIAQAKAMPHRTPEERAERRRLLAQAKVTPHAEQRRQEIRAARQACRDTRERNREIAAAPFVLGELRKFHTRRWQKQYEAAQRVMSFGIAGLSRIDVERDLLALAHGEKGGGEAKLIRSDLHALARSVRRSQRLIHKCYPQGIPAQEPAVPAAVEGKNAASFTDFLRKRRVFRLALQEQPIYRRCIAPYTGAAALVRQADHYSHLDERRERYQSAVEKKEEKIPFAVTAI